MEYQAKLNEKHACFTLHFKFCRYFLKELQDPAASSFISCCFYISRHDFLQPLRASLNIIWKKDFCHKYSCFDTFKHPHPFNNFTPNFFKAIILIMCNSLKVIENTFFVVQIFCNHFGSFFCASNFTVLFSNLLQHSP